MSQQAGIDWTIERFLDWEERQAIKHEFDGIAPHAMTGDSVAHAAIQRNLAVAAATRLRGRPCQFYGSELKIRVSDRIRYPDGLIVCTPLLREATIVDDPVVVLEIISPSTARTDKIVKLREYLAVPSIRRYVIIEQDFIGATDLTRVADNWQARSLTGDDALDLPEVGIAFPLGEVYADLVYPEPNDFA